MDTKICDIQVRVDDMNDRINTVQNERRELLDAGPYCQSINYNGEITKVSWEIGGGSSPVPDERDRTLEAY